MSVILVAEQDASYAERIVEVLNSAGWDAKAVVSRETAFEAANTQRPGLLIASASLPEASSLLAAFSRNRGGPGSVVLVPVAVAGRVSAADYQADALLDKPFSDDALTQIVRGCLESNSSLDGKSRDENRATGQSIPQPVEAMKAATQQLTSEDIFGDVLAEVEAEAQRSKATRRQRAMQSSDEVERKLEETLSGVFPLGDRSKRPPRSEPPSPTVPSTAPAAPPDRNPRSRVGLASSDHEIEDLLDKTLSSLELPKRIRKTSSESTPQPAPQPVAPPETQPAPVPPSNLAQLPDAGSSSKTPVPVEPAEAASVAWEGFEPPPELFPASFGEAMSEPLLSEPGSGLFEPASSPSEPPPQPAVFEPESRSDSFDLASIPADEPALDQAHTSDLFPTSFDPAPATEFATPSFPTPGPPTENPAPPEDLISLGEERLPDFFNSSLGDNPAPEADAELPTIDPPPEMFNIEPLTSLPAKTFEEPMIEVADTAPGAANSSLSDDLTFDLFPASFGESSPAPAAEADLGTDLPPELFPSSFGEDAPAPSWDTPPDIPPPPELAAPVSVLQATGLETQRMPALSEYSLLEDEVSSSPSAELGSVQDAAANSITTKDTMAGDEHFTTHRMVALEDIATPPTKEGETFGDYTLIDRVAVGGMAEVWRARRRGVEGFQKTVAIKRILSHLTDTPDFINMFIDEAKLAAQLSHNHIIQIYDLGKVGDDFFIAMEFVDGKDLRSILDKSRKLGRPIPIELALMIVASLARALDYAHRKKDFENRAMGLVHRDVSPQNVLISYEGEIKLCDFGIVKAVAKASTTQMGALKGKLQYMSPEQAWGKSVDARSDIFSLGSVLFEVLTGERLFTGDSELNVLDAVRECRVRSPRDLVPDIPEEVDQIVLRTLTGTPEERYQTAKELEQDINSALDSLRLTPSQSHLATYVGQLFNPPVEFHNYEAAEPQPPAALPDKVSPAHEAEAQAQPTTDNDTTSGGSQPRKWLLPVLLLVALAAIAAFAFYAMSQRGESSSAPPSTPSEVSTPEGVSLGPNVGEPGVESDSGGPASEENSTSDGAEPKGGARPEDARPEEGGKPRDGATQEASSAAETSTRNTVEEGSSTGDPAASPVDRYMEEKLAETEREIQRKYDAQLEADRQRIQRELERAQKNLKNPPRPPPQELNPDDLNNEESDGR